MRREYLVAEGVSFAFPKGDWVIRELDLVLRRAECTVIIGENGSGKTTLGKLFCGILRPRRGRILIDGRDSREISLGAVGRKIGYLFQNPDRQLFALSVREELAFALRLQGIDQAIVDQRVSRVLDRFQLGQMEGRLPQRLSQGEKQRLALAAVMLQQPEYLILDEPTSSLDDTRRRQLSRELKALREAGIGMLIITHDQSLVGEHAERILRLQAGRVISDETASP